MEADLVLEELALRGQTTLVVNGAERGRILPLAAACSSTLDHLLFAEKSGDASQPFSARWLAKDTRTGAVCVAEIHGCHAAYFVAGYTSIGETPDVHLATLSQQGQVHLWALPPPTESDDVCDFVSPILKLSSPVMAGRVAFATATSAGAIRVESVPAAPGTLVVGVPSEKESTRQYVASDGASTLFCIVTDGVTAAIRLPHALAYDTRLTVTSNDVLVVYSRSMDHAMAYDIRASLALPRENGAHPAVAVMGLMGTWLDMHARDYANGVYIEGIASTAPKLSSSDATGVYEYTDAMQQATLWTVETLGVKREGPHATIDHLASSELVLPWDAELASPTAPSAREVAAAALAPTYLLERTHVQRAVVVALPPQWDPAAVAVVPESTQRDSFVVLDAYHYASAHAFALTQGPEKRGWTEVESSPSAAPFASPHAVATAKRTKVKSLDSRAPRHYQAALFTHPDVHLRAAQAFELVAPVANTELDAATRTLAVELASRPAEFGWSGPYTDIDLKPETAQRRLLHAVFGNAFAPASRVEFALSCGLLGGSLVNPLDKAHPLRQARAHIAPGYFDLGAVQDVRPLISGLLSPVDALPVLLPGASLYEGVALGAGGLVYTRVGHSIYYASSSQPTELLAPRELEGAFEPIPKSAPLGVCFGPVRQCHPRRAGLAAPLPDDEDTLVYGWIDASGSVRLRLASCSAGAVTVTAHRAAHVPGIAGPILRAIADEDGTTLVCASGVHRLRYHPTATAVATYPLTAQYAFASNSGRYAVRFNASTVLDVLDLDTGATLGVETTQRRIREVAFFEERMFVLSAQNDKTTLTVCQLEGGVYREEATYNVSDALAPYGVDAELPTLALVCGAWVSAWVTQRGVLVFSTARPSDAVWAPWGVDADGAPLETHAAQFVPHPRLLDPWGLWGRGTRDDFACSKRPSVPDETAWLLEQAALPVGLVAGAPDGVPIANLLVPSTAALASAHFPAKLQLATDVAYPLVGAPPQRGNTPESRETPRAFVVVFKTEKQVVASTWPRIGGVLSRIFASAGGYAGLYALLSTSSRLWMRPTLPFEVVINRQPMSVPSLLAALLLQPDLAAYVTATAADVNYAYVPGAFSDAVTAAANVATVATGGTVPPLAALGGHGLQTAISVLSVIHSKSNVVRRATSTILAALAPAQPLCALVGNAVERWLPVGALAGGASEALEAAATLFPYMSHLGTAVSVGKVAVLAYKLSRVPRVLWKHYGAAQCLSVVKASETSLRGAFLAPSAATYPEIQPAVREVDDDGTIITGAHYMGVCGVTRKPFAFPPTLRFRSQLAGGALASYTRWHLWPLRVARCHGSYDGDGRAIALDSEPEIASATPDVVVSKDAPYRARISGLAFAGGAHWLRETLKRHSALLRERADDAGAAAELRDVNYLLWTVPYVEDHLAATERNARIPLGDAVVAAAVAVGPGTLMAAPAPDHRVRLIYSYAAAVATATGDLESFLSPTSISLTDDEGQSGTATIQRPARHSDRTKDGAALQTRIVLVKAVSPTEAIVVVQFAGAPSDSYDNFLVCVTPTRARLSVVALHGASSAAPVVYASECAGAAIVRAGTAPFAVPQNVASTYDALRLFRVSPNTAGGAVRVEAWESAAPDGPEPPSSRAYTWASLEGSRGDDVYDLVGGDMLGVAGVVPLLASSVACYERRMIVLCKTDRTPDARAVVAGAKAARDFARRTVASAAGASWRIMTGVAALFSRKKENDEAAAKREKDVDALRRRAKELQQYALVEVSLVPPNVRAVAGVPRVQYAPTSALATALDSVLTSSRGCFMLHRLRGVALVAHNEVFVGASAATTRSYTIINVALEESGRGVGCAYLVASARFLSNSKLRILAASVGDYWTTVVAAPQADDSNHTEELYLLTAPWCTQEFSGGIADALPLRLSFPGGKRRIRVLSVHINDTAGEVAALCLVDRKPKYFVWHPKPFSM